MNITINGTSRPRGAVVVFAAGYDRNMRPVVLMAAIGASAVLGGVVGGALVRTADRTADRKGSERTAGTQPRGEQRWWYCVFFDAAALPSTDRNHFTTCSRDVVTCQQYSCLVSPRAWCGSTTCTLTEQWCEQISGNEPCRLETP